MSLSARLAAAQNAQQAAAAPEAPAGPERNRPPWVDGRIATVVFYASAPLITPAGHALGTLCVFDSVPKALTESQIERLRDLAEVIVGLFERRRQSRRNAELATETARSRKFIGTLLGRAPDRGR